MRDRRLERQLLALEEFLERWGRLNQTFKRSFQRQAVGAKDEEDFLFLKGALAQDYESLMSEIALERDPEDRTVQVLSSVTSLKRLEEMTLAEQQLLETAWHQSYIRLQTLLGRLKAQKLQLASVSVVGYYIGRVLRSPVFILLLLGVVLAAALWVWNLTQAGPNNLIEPRGPRPTQAEKVPNL